MPLTQYIRHIPVLTLVVQFLMLALSFFCPAAASTVSPLLLTDPHGRYALLDHMSFWEDMDRSLTIETVTALKNQERFVPRDGRRTNFGFSPSVFWARLQVQNQSTEDQWYVLLHNAGVRTADRIDLYLPRADGGFEVLRQGEAVGSAHFRSPYISAPAFRLLLVPGRTYTFYLRIQDEGLVFLPLSLYSVSSLQALAAENLLWFLLLGAFGFFLVYNLLLYSSLRDSVFLYFSVMLAAFPLFVLVAELNRFAPGLPVWWGNRIKDASYLYYWAAWLLLTKSYFKLDDPATGLNRWIRGLLAIILGLGVAAFILPYHWVARAATLGGIVIGLSIFVISILAWRRGFAAGRYYVVAVGFTFLVGCLRDLNTLGMMGAAQFQNRVGTILFLMISLLFYSFALIDRHNILSKEMLAAQQQAVKSLRQAEQAKDDFLANTSHELRTPLHGMIGLCEDLLSDDGHPPKAGWENPVRLILLSARRLSALIDDLLDFTRIRQGRLHLSPRPVDAASVVKSAVALCRPLIGAKPLSIRSDFADDLPPVLADEGRLQQILLNLIKNAITFTSAGEIRISAEVADAFLRITVADTGPGIPEDRRIDVFNRFVQLDSTVDRAHEGTGLGLAIVRQLVELHGGRIEVADAVGGGACFTLTLALADGPVAGADDPGARSVMPVPVLPDPPPSISAGQGDRVLIVDDDAISLHVVHNHLSSAGYQVLSARDAFAARKMLADHTVDLVVLDLMMPRMNGYELCRELRREYNATELPVIMLTARTQTEDLVKGFDCGANDYLTKPVNRMELLARIQTGLKLKALADLLRENKGLKAEIVQRRRAEQALTAANRQLAGLLDLWESALLLVDADRQILYCNQQAEQLFHRPAHDMVTSSLELLFPPAATTQHALSLPLSSAASAASAGQSVRRQVAARMPDGSTIELEVIVTPISVKAQTLYALLCRDGMAPGGPLPASTDVVKTLAMHHRKVQAMQGAFDSALNFLDQEGRHLRAELQQLDCVMKEALDRMPGNELESLYRETVVALMGEALACWIEVTGTDKVALAEQSGIWRTYLDVSTFKTRTLDKYLSLDRLPKNPRWKDVLKTADFVRASCGGDHSSLNACLAQFRAVLRAKQLM